MYGITLLKLVVVAQSHGGLVTTPPPAPPPLVPQAVAVAPSPVPVPPVLSPTPSLQVAGEVAPVQDPTTTTTTTTTTVPPIVTVSNVQCVVYDPTSQATFSPGPADANGSCAYLVSQYPADDTITPTQETATEQVNG